MVRSHVLALALPSLKDFRLRLGKFLDRQVPPFSIEWMFQTKFPKKVLRALGRGKIESRITCQIRLLSADQKKLHI
jgi:hypothetical protein